MKKSNIKKNILYNITYNILAIIIPIVTTPYITRVLGAENIGEYTYAHSIAYYFVLFAMLGLSNYGNRTIAAVRDDQDKLNFTFSSIYLMQLFTSIISVFAYVVYIIVFQNDLLSWIMLAYVVSSIFDINWLFFGLEQFKITVMRNILIKILSTLSIFLFVKRESDMWIYAVILTSSILISQVAIWPYVVKNVKFVKVCLGDVLEHIKPNIILFVPFIAVSLYKIMDKIMLGRISDMQNVGFYESAEKIITVPTTIINALGTVMMPRITNMLANNEKTEGIFYKSSEIAVGVASLMCFGIMGVADIFVPWFMGDKFAPCINIILVLAPSCVFLAYANVIRTQHLIPRKKDKTFTMSLVCGAVVNLVLNTILIPFYGALGAAIGTLVAEIVVCIYQIIAIRKDINIKESISNCIKYILAGTLMYFIIDNINIISNISIINISYKALIGFAIYCIVLLGIKSVKKN